MNNLELIYITAPDKSVATKIAKALVQEKLAACVNVLGGMDSFYLWEGKVTQSEEVLLFAKTRKERDLMDRVKELHPYECPCIISFNISSGEPSFLEWIAKTNSNI